MLLYSLYIIFLARELAIWFTIYKITADNLNLHSAYKHTEGMISFRKYITSKIQA